MENVDLVWFGNTMDELLFEWWLIKLFSLVKVAILYTPQTGINKLATNNNLWYLAECFKSKYVKNYPGTHLWCYQTKPEQNFPFSVIFTAFIRLYLWITPKSAHVWFGGQWILVRGCHGLNLPYSTPLYHFLNKYSETVPLCNWGCSCAHWGRGLRCCLKSPVSGTRDTEWTCEVSHCDAPGSYRGYRLMVSD